MWKKSLGAAGTRTNQGNGRRFGVLLVILGAVFGLLGLGFGTASSASATGAPSTATMAWMMPGSNPQGVVWPQDGKTYGHTVPSCTPTGDKKFQKDIYKYDTPEHKSKVDALRKQDTLNQGDDQSVWVSATFVTPPKCESPPPSSDIPVTAVRKDCKTATVTLPDTNSGEPGLVVKTYNGSTLLASSDGSTSLGVWVTTVTNIPTAAFPLTVKVSVDGKLRTTKVFNLPAGEKCTPEKVLVTPASPTTTTPSCTSPNEVVTLPTQAGVIWTPSAPTTLKPAQSVTYTASAAAGYQFPNDDSIKSSFTFKNTFDAATCVVTPAPAPQPQPAPAPAPVAASVPKTVPAATDHVVPGSLGTGAEEQITTIPQSGFGFGFLVAGGMLLMAGGTVLMSSRKRGVRQEG